jgi:citrate lyase subunit beta/citryl-CoA lyase
MVEDAVQLSAKAEARALLAAHLAARPAGGPKLAVRVNGPGHPVEPRRSRGRGAAETGPGHAAEDGRPGGRRRTRRPHRRARAGVGRTGILVVATETVGSVLSLAALDWRHPRLRGMLWAARTSPPNSAPPPTAMPMAPTPARSASPATSASWRRGGPASSPSMPCTPTSAISMPSPPRRKPRAATASDGKAAIHPAQVDVINAVFRPTEAEIAWAHRVIEALASSATGIALFDGQMVDAPHAARARRILARG